MKNKSLSLALFAAGILSAQVKADFTKTLPPAPKVSCELFYSEDKGQGSENIQTSKSVEASVKKAAKITLESFNLEARLNFYGPAGGSPNGYELSITLSKDVHADYTVSAVRSDVLSTDEIKIGGRHSLTLVADETKVTANCDITPKK